MPPNADARYGYDDSSGYRSCTSIDPSDRRRHWCGHDADDLYPSDYPFPSSTATQATDSLPTGATFINGSSGNSNSLNPIAVIVPTIVGAALLILGVGAFLLWRRRRRRAAAAAAAAGEESGGTRGGEMAGVGGAAAAAEKFEIPPRYEDSRHDRSIPVPVAPPQSENPFADPDDPEPEYEPPMSPVSEVERAVVTDGLRRQPSGVSEVSRVSAADSRRGLVV